MRLTFTSPKSIFLHPRQAAQPSAVAGGSNRRGVLTWFVLGFSAGSVVAAVVGFETFGWRLPVLSKSAGSGAIFEAPAHPGSTNKLYAKEASHAPHLAYQDAKGAINDALPLGIVLNDSSGGETLVLSDFAEGTQLSAGTALSPTRWSVHARDLNKVFIAAPQNFSGSMQVTAKLYSSDNLVLETRSIQFEWIRSQAEPRPATTDLTQVAFLNAPYLAGKNATGSSNDSSLTSAHGTDAPTISPVLLPPNAPPSAQKPPAPVSSPAALLEQGERLLRKGNVAAARVLLKRAVDAGSADAAVDLGVSFDPAYVPRAGNPANADAAKAAWWYQRAIKLGRKDVAANLKRLTNVTNTATR